MEKQERGSSAPSASAEIITIPSSFFRMHARDLMERVKYRGERFIVETFKRPMVVLISYEDYLRVRSHLLEYVDEAQAEPESAVTGRQRDSTASQAVQHPARDSFGGASTDAEESLP